MSNGWICPKCGRVLAPWVSECPCYFTNLQVTCTQIGTAWGNTNTGKGSAICPACSAELDNHLRAAVYEIKKQKGLE